MFEQIRNWLRRRRYREGCTLSRFIACDVRRDVLVVSAARVADGIIVGRVRTTNLLYRSHGLVEESEFGPARELRLNELWRWTGQPWGGLSDGSSLADQLASELPAAEPDATPDPPRG